MKYWLSFDDAAALDMRVAELLRKHNLTATFFIPVMWQSHNLLNGYEPLNRPQVQELADNFEIGSHTISHPHLTKIPHSMAEYEIVTSKRLLQEMFGKPITKFCYPRGYGTDQIRDIVRRNYDVGRNTLVGSIEESEDSAWQSTSAHLGYQRAEYGGQDWFEYAQNLLTRAINKDKYYIAWGHSWEIEKYNGWNALDRLLGVLSEAVS